MSANTPNFGFVSNDTAVGIKEAIQTLHGNTETITAHTAAIAANTADIAKLKENAAHTVRKYSASRTSSHNGIDYVEINGVFDIHGTATPDNSVFAIEGGQTSIPDWVEPGDYYVSFKKNDRTYGVTPVTDDVRLQFILYYSDNSSNVVYNSEGSGKFTLTNDLLYQCVGAYVRFLVPNGKTAGSKIFLKFMNAPANTELLEMTEELATEIKESNESVYSSIMDNAVLRDTTWAWNAGVNSLTGGNRADAPGYCRTAFINALRPLRYSLGDLKDTYEFNVFTYQTTDTSTFIRALKPQYDDADVVVPSIKVEDTVGKYRLCIRRKDNAEMDGDYEDTSSDAYALINGIERYRATDATLSQDSVPADAAVVGEELADLKQDNATVIRKYSATRSLTHNGVEYTETNGIFDIYGTATPDNSVCRVEGNTNSIPAWVAPGTYYIDFKKYDRTDGATPVTDDVMLQVILYYSQDSGKPTNTVFSSVESGNITLTADMLDDDLVGFYIRFRVVKNKSAASKCVVRFLTAPSNRDLADRFTNIGPVNLRVMQYNAGKWRFGITGDEPLSGQSLGILVPNYRKFFAKYKPDIIGMQEYLTYMGADSSCSAADEVFDPLFAYTVPAVLTGTNETKIYSNYKLKNDRMVWEDSTVDGTTYWSCFCVTEITVNNKKVGIATGYLSATGGKDVRLEHWTYYLSTVFDKYDYMIIMSDINSSYYLDANDEPTDTDDDETAGHKQIVDYAKSQGYTACNELDGYWGTMKTYLAQYSSITKQYYSALDEIFVRGNIKIRNFEVCKDAQNEIENSDPTKYNYVDREILNRQADDPYVWLASDHLPIIADLVIY